LPSLRNLCDDAATMRKAVHVLLRVVAPLLVFAVIPFAPNTASRTEAGSPIVVNTTADSGAGSLRQALITAGNNPGADTITFDPSVFPPHSSATIQPITNYVIEGDAALQPLTIDATGAGVVIDFQFVQSGGAGLHFRPSGNFSGLSLINFVIENFHPGSGGNGVEVGFQADDVSNILIQSMIFQGNDGEGISLSASGAMSNVVIQDSIVGINTGNGIFMEAESMDNVHLRRNGAHSNHRHGIELKAGASPVPATVDLTENNLTNNGEDAIFIGDMPHVTLARNATHNNDGLGINLEGGNEDAFGVTANDPGDADDGPNRLLNFPVLNGVGPTGVVGTACAHCTVELYIADSDPSNHGEGAGYFTTGTADASGNFNINACGQNEGANVTALATDPQGNSSEYAANYILPAKPACPHLNGDNDCDGNITSLDALIQFRHEISNQISRPPDCPDMGSHISAFALAPAGETGPDFFGDVNCDGDLTTLDAINILQVVSDLDVKPAPPDGCAAIGDPIPA
jgi:hypothetical protein